MSFLWLTEDDVGRFFRNLISVDFSDEIQRQIDFRSREYWEMRLYDAWGHCFLGAASTRSISEPLTWAIGGSYEIVHEGLAMLLFGVYLVEHDSYAQDTFNQAVGRSIGTANPTGDLGQICFDAMMSGRLDLTQAGIPRGGRLRRTASGGHHHSASVRPRVRQWRYGRA
jgi:hypothetical protein